MPATAAGSLAAAVTAKALGQRAVATSPEFARDMQLLAATTPYGAFVHFDQASPAEHRALMDSLKLKVGYDFEDNADALYVIGPVAAFQSLMSHPWVQYLEANTAMRYMDDTDSWATRVRVAQEPVSNGPYYDAAGNILRGQGVGIGVVDSGFRGDHPDFAKNLKRNYRVTCPVPTADEANIAMCQFTDLGTTASTEVAGGHGTHCAGIALGDGSASKGIYPTAEVTPNISGTYTGVAPGANLYGFGAGAATQILLLNAAAGFDKIIKDNASNANNPKVRVISNSYGGDGAFDPNAVVSKLTNRAIDAGISVVFAAGNDGAAEASTAADPSKTGASCRNPKPGLICVASYNDNGTGARNASLSSFSSRAEVSRTSEYPDIAAPGDLITAVCSQGDPGQAVCTTGAETKWQPYYGTISGTSMATPHVAGIIALMYQARPDLTPAQVEKIIKDNALKLTSEGPYVADPSNTGGTTNAGYGAGLIDLPRILDALGAKHGTLPAAGNRVIADGDTETGIAGAADIVKVQMLEEAKGGINGITYSLTLRDATAFGTPAASQARLMVKSNVDGNPYTSGVVLKPDGTVSVIGRSAQANAAATSASKTGNVIKFFVPLGSLGGPAVGAPIHNIQAISYLTTTQGESAADYTPSSTATAALAALQPVFGKPYTVLNASLPVAEDICTVPGATLLTDGTGDIFAASGQSSDEGHDLQSLKIAQPYYSNGDYKLVFTLKVLSLTALPPQTTWPVNFCSPGFACINPDTNTAPYSATNQYYTLRMTTDPSIVTGASSAAPVFQVLAPSATSTTAATRTITTLPQGTGLSGYKADGTITFVVKASDIGLTAGKAGVEALSKFQSRVAVGSTAATVTPDNMPDGLSGDGLYPTRPVAFCAPNQLPVAVLTADKKTANRGTTFSFSGATSSDPDAGDTIASYTFDFGDGSMPATGTAPTATHSYAHSGSYSATLKVTDSKGAASAGLPAAGLGITVTNTAPVAAYTSDKTSGAAPLTVSFDATPSSDADSNDKVMSYSFDLDGDGVYEIADSTNPKASKTYSSNGTVTTRVKVKDSEGMESAVSTKSIVIGSTTVPAVISETGSSKAVESGRFGGGAAGLSLLAVFVGAGLRRRCIRR